MDAEGASLLGGLGAALVALVWVLVRRARRARRLMPRARVRFHFSMRTPESDPPNESDEERDTTRPPTRKGKSDGGSRR